MWPDEAISESSYQQIFLQKCLKYLWLIGLFWKTALLMEKLLWMTFGQLLEKLGCFLFEHVNI